MAWQEVASDEGVYYYNDETQETTWDKPEELFDEKERAIAAIGWRQARADDGAMYWYHESTQQSVWDIPPEVQAIIDKFENGQAQTQAAGPASNTQQQHEQQEHQQQQHSYTYEKVATDTHSYRSTSRLLPEYVQPVGSVDKQREDFISILDSEGIDDTWTWDDAMEKLVDKPQYWSVPDSLDRKKIFEEYMEKIKGSRQQMRQKENEERRESMREQLSKYPIKHYTRWRTMKAQLEQAQDPVFAQVEDDREKRLVFEQHVAKLRKKHEEQVAKDRQKAIDQLADLLRHSEIDVHTKWDDAKAIAKHSSVADVDVLNTFSKYMRELEDRANEVKNREKQIQYRKERKNRDRFVELLQELQAQNKVNADTKWKDILPLFKDDQRYIDVCGQPGSTPLDLFWDVVEEHERKLKAQREAILDILASNRVPIEECHSYDKFARVVKFDPRGNEFDSATLHAVYERLRKSAEQKRDEDRHAEERRMSRMVDDLRRIIKHLEPPVTLDDSWDRVKRRIEHLDEYKALSEDRARLAHDRHVRYLKDRLQSEREYERDMERRRRDAERIARNEQASQPRGLDEGPYMDY